MLGFELKRLIKNKELLMSIIAIIIILISNIILESVFYKDNISPNLRLVNLYNSFSQFMFLVFAPILGGLVSNDFNNNSIYFYLNNNISIKKYYFNRIFSFIIMLTSILTVIFFLYYTIFELPLYESFIVFISLLISFNFMVVISGVLSLIFKKKGKTSMMIIFTWFIMSVINIIPIKGIKGKMFLVDNNSYTSYIISNFLGVNGSNINFKNSINVTNTNLFIIFGIGLFWISVYIIITYILLLKDKRNIQ